MRSVSAGHQNANVARGIPMPNDIEWEQRGSASHGETDGAFYSIATRVMGSCNIASWRRLPLSALDGW